MSINKCEFARILFDVYNISRFDDIQINNNLFQNEYTVI